MVSPRESHVISLPRRYELVVAAVLGAIAVSLLVFVAWILNAALSDSSRLQSPFAAGITLAFSIGAVFAVMSWRLLAGHSSTGLELLSLAGWRRLSILLFVVAILTALTLHWFAGVPPAIIGGLCLLKDPRIAQWLAWL
jgi:hypothetical protein